MNAPEHTFDGGVQRHKKWQGDMFALVELLHQQDIPGGVSWVGQDLCINEVVKTRSKAAKRQKTQAWSASGGLPPHLVDPSGHPSNLAALGYPPPTGTDTLPSEPQLITHLIPAGPLALSLPPHLLGCCLLVDNADGPTWGSDMAARPPSAVGPLQHVVWGVDALARLCELVPDFPTRVLSPPELARFRSTVMDLVLLVLAGVAGPIQSSFNAATADFKRQDVASDAARLASCCFTLLAQTLSPQNSSCADGDVDWEAVCEHLLLHPKGCVLVELLFDASGSLMVMVERVAAAHSYSAAGPGPQQHAHAALSALGSHVGSCVGTLAALCSMPLFYQALMMLDPSARAPLRLLANGLDIWRMLGHVPLSSAGTLALLSARCTALLLVLMQHYQPDFLDRSMAAGSSSAPRMAFIAHTIQTMLVHYCRQTCTMLSVETDQGSPQLFVNLLRVAEIFADETNFREGMIQQLTPPLAALLAADGSTFRAWWCAGEAVQRVHMHDALYVYSVTYSAYEAALQIREAAAELVETPDSLVAYCKARGAQVEPEWERVREMSLERAVQLCKLVVNLHFFDEETCDMKLKGRFLSCLLDEWGLHTSPREAKQKMAAAARNLQALLHLLHPLLPGQPLGLEEDTIVTDQDQETVHEILAHIQSHL